MIKPESFEKKMHIARDVEGNPRREELEIIRQLEEKLSLNKSFVGLAPFGSLMGGYGTKESDIDLFILCDDPELNKPLSEQKQPSDSDFLQKQAYELGEEMKRNGRNVEFIFQNINPDYLVKSAKFWLKNRGNLGDYVPLSLEAMTRVVTGKKIDQYRKAMAEKFDELDQKQKRMAADEIMKSLVKREIASLRKRERRMLEISPEDHQKILSAREAMWRDRIRKIWNL